MKKKTKKKRAIKQPSYRCFIVDWGCYPEQTIVFIGKRDNIDVMISSLKKLGVSADRAKKVADGIQKHSTRGSADSDRGAFYFLETDEDWHANLLWLPKWGPNPSWELYESLIHELHHAVQVLLAKGRSMEHEMEALAYAQQSLFQTIRRQLDGGKEMQEIRS